MRAAGAGGGDAGLVEVLRTVQARRAERGSGGLVAGAPTTAPPTAAAPAGGAGGAGRILAIDTYGPTVRVFHIGRPAGFTFVAGQHLKLGAAGGKRATFSIASAPH